MTAAMLLALATPAQIAAWDGLPIPDEIGVPAAGYVTCISDGVLDDMAVGTPPAPAERQEVMDLTLEDCRHERMVAAEAMNARMAGEPGWTEPAIRAAKVERILAAAEERVGFTMTHPESFKKMVEQLRLCRAAGSMDCEDAAMAHMPAPARKN